MADETDFNFSPTPEQGATAPQPQDDSVVTPTSQTAPILSPTSSQTFGNAMTYGLPGLGLGLLDTIGQSLGVLHNDSMPNALKNFTGDGANSLGDFYTRNQAQLRAGGEIAGMLLPGLGAMKALKTVNGLREAGSIGAWAKNSASLDVLLGNSAELTAAETNIGTKVSSAAADQGVWAGRTINTPAVIAAKRGYYAKRAVDAARTTVAFELGNRAAFNSSDTFYPADYTLTDQAKWAAAGLGVGIGVEMIAAKYAIRNMIQTAINATNTGAAQDVLNVSPLAKDVDKTIFRPNQRGVGVTQYAGLAADLKDTASVSGQSATLQTNLAQDQVNIKNILSTQISNMAYDTHEFLPRTSLAPDQINLGLKALENNTTSLLYAKKIAQLPADGLTDFYAGIAKDLDAAKTKYNTAAFAASSLPDPADQVKAITAANAELSPIEAAASEMHYVLEPDGRYSVYKNRADNWLDTNSFSAIKRKTYTTPLTTGPLNSTMTNSKLLVKGTNDIVLHDNFRAEIPKGATPTDFSALYAAGSKMINEYKPVEGQTFVLTPQLNWRTLEMTSALAKVNPQAKSAIQFGGAQLPTPTWKDLASLSKNDLQTLAKNAPPASSVADTGAVGDIGVSREDAQTMLREHQDYSNYSTDDLVNTMRRTLFENKDPNWISKVKNGANPLPEQSASFVRLQGAYSALKDQGYDFKNLPSDLRTNAINQYGNPNDTSEVLGSKLQNLFGQAGPAQIGAGGAPKQFNLYNTAQGFSSLDDVDFHVLNQKFQEFNSLMPNTTRAPVAKTASLLGRTGSSKTNLTPAEVIQRLNLPEPQGLNPSPTIEMFAHAKLQGMTDLNQMFPKPTGSILEAPYTQMDLVNQHLRETAGIPDNVDTVIPSQGVLLKQTSDTKPLFVAAKSTPMIARADAEIGGRVQALRDVQLQRLSQIDPKTSPLVNGVIGKIVTAGKEGGDLSGAANQARAVQTLQDGILSGTGQVVYQDRINEQFPTLKAAQLIAQDGDKFVDNYVATLANNNLTPRYATILAPKNKNDLFDFNRVEQAYRHGWEIEKMVPSPVGGGGYVFKLKEDSKINKQLAALHFQDEDGTTAIGGSRAGSGFMPDMSVTAKKAGYSPLIVSKNAGDLAQAISDMSIQSGKENNALRMALGKNGIQLRDFHLPTPELNKEGTWFVRNPTGRVIATYTGPNFGQNEIRAKKAADILGDMHVAVPLDTVKADHQINDDNFFSLIDYSDQLAKTGAAIQGGLAHTEIDTGPITLKAMVKSLQEQYLNVGIRSRAAVFEPELNYARQAAATATAATRTNSGGINIFDRYISTMFSQSPNTNKGVIGKAYGGLEDALDRSLSWMNAKFTEATGSPENASGARTMLSLVRKGSSEEEFKQFQKVLPSWSPFQEAQQWAESTFREKTPLTSRDMATSLAKLSSTMSLRFLDVGSAINNFAGLATNTPSLMYALRRGSNENYDQWISRTAAWGTQLKDDTMTFSPMKAMGSAIKSLWSGELTGPMMDAAKHGYFEPEYASLTKALTTPQKPSSAAVHNFVQTASYLADKSEIMSRQIAWGMGYKIGKELHGFTDDRNSYIFANNFVNELIGNYSPNNKPAMFQGAVGLPLGAFQTYMFNFYRRMYSNIERGDKASIVAQYAAQASLFGWQSVPGYSAWNSVFQSNASGSDDFTSRIERKFAPGVGELLLHGSISNIPKIWGGLQADGLAFYSRGSVDLTQPVPTLLDMSKAPPMQFLYETAKGINATINNVFSSAGYSQQQEEEILARFTTNRAMKSIMELAANVKTTERGDVIQQGTRDAIHVAAALLGTQPSSVRSLQEASRRQQNVELTQEDLRASLTDHTRAIFRSGNISIEQLQGTVHDYIKAGGNPAYLGQWFRNSFMTANTPQTTKKLEELGRSGKMLEFQDMLATLQQNQNPNAPKENK